MPAPAATPPAASNSRIHPAVVRVIVPLADGNSLGSGVLVHKNERYGIVITNHHVVRGGTGTITIVFPGGFQSAGQLLKVDSDWDLAAIAVWRPDAEPVAISTAPPRPGELLTIAGYGSGAFRMQTGPCTQYFSPGKDLPHELVELAAKARQGDSGGPIFNTQGQLSGVLFGEGGGRTIGSYGGRVDWFLADVLPQVDQGMPNSSREMVAEVAPRAEASANRYEAGLPQVVDAPIAANDRWSSAPATRDAGEPLIVRKPLPANDSVASNTTEQSPRKWPRIELPGDNAQGNLAQLESSGSPLFATGTDGASRIFSDDVHTPDGNATEWESAQVPESNGPVTQRAQLFAWQDLAGLTPWDKTKSILATIGALVVLVQLLKVFGYLRSAPSTEL